MASEHPFARWARRAVTIPAYLLAAAVLLLAAPLLFPLCAAIDISRRRGLVLVRCLAMVDVFLLAEAAGMAASLAIWLRGSRGSAAYRDRNFRLQCWWASTLFSAGARIFRLRVRVEGDAEAAAGPVIVLVRHVSAIDNLIPAVLLSDHHGTRLRWVLNRWLLRDPCLDIVGHRLANAFVRGGAESDQHVAAVAALGRDLGRDEGAIIYPEGALFSASRRDRAVARLSDSPFADRAAALANVLPPRPRGTLALLDAAPDADIVFCAHRGLESAGSYRAFMSGGLIGKDLTVTFWRIPRATVPETREARLDWLYARWAEVDAWVATPAPRAMPSAPVSLMGGVA